MKIVRRLISAIVITFLIFGNIPRGYASKDTVELKISFSKGQAAFYNQNYSEAEQNFKIAVEKAKAIGNREYYAISYGYLGFSQVYLDNLKEAEATLKEALQYIDEPAMTPIAKMVTLLACIEFYSRLGEIDIVQKYIQITLAQEEASFYAIGITKEPLRNLYKSNQIVLKTISELSSSSEAENYIEDALLNGKVMRWNDETKFIKVYISPGNNIKGWNPEYAEDFKKACLVWQNVLKNKVQFEFVENESDAVDTVVTWHADRNIRPALTDYSIYKKNNLIKVDIVFHLIDNSNQFLVPRTVYKCSLHELGHLLGISGHSRNPDDIMFPARTYAIKPSVRDVSTLLELYSRPAEVTNPKAKTLSEYREEVVSQGKYSVEIFNH